MKSSGCARDFFQALVMFLILLVVAASMVQEHFPVLWAALPFLFGFFFWFGVQIVFLRLFSKNWVTTGGCVTLLVENIVFMILFSVFSAGWGSVLVQDKTGPVTRNDWQEAGYSLADQYVSALPMVRVVLAPKSIRSQGVEQTLYAAGVSGIEVAYTLNFGAYGNNGGTTVLSETAKGETEVVIYADDFSPSGWTPNQKAQYLTFLGGCQRGDWGRSQPRTAAQCGSEARKFVESKNAKAENFLILP